MITLNRPSSEVKRTLGMQTAQIDLNEQFQKALRLMGEPDVPVFITGKAGTGKSTLLRYFRETTKKQVAVLAPTGVAAVNIQGQTIHSFFEFRPDITPEGARKTANRILRQNEASLYQELSALVIDEISMVRADLLDCVDQFLRVVRKRKDAPFGGLKMIFIGDLYQLPPVVTSAERAIFSDFYPSPYFFDSQVAQQMELVMVELETVYRQKDEGFIGLLNAVRNNTLSDSDLRFFNERYHPDFQPPKSKDDFYIVLTATNKQALEMNVEALQRIPGKLRRFEGIVDGDFDQGSLPTDRVLELKPGAQVMMVNNDTLGRWVNGTMAVIDSFSGDKILVKIEGGGTEEIVPYQWELFRYVVDSKKKFLETETIGTFTQYPIKLAWAVTIHKSQGKTFDHAIIDVGNGTFATGQMYVALSRCRTLEGLVLKRRLLPGHVRIDYKIVNFLTQFQY